MTRRPSRWLAALVAAVGLSLAGLALGVSAASDHIDAPLATGIVGAWIGVSFLGVGLFAWYRRPSQHTGLLMIGVSYVWLLSGLNGANDSLPSTIGSYLSPVYVLLVIQLIAEFPNRPLDRTMRVLLGAGYITVFLLRLPAFLFQSDLYDGMCKHDCPSNAFLVSSNGTLADAGNYLSLAAGALIVGVVSWRTLRRRREAPATVRREQAPVLATSLVARRRADRLVRAPAVRRRHGAASVFRAISLLAFAVLPYAFLIGLVRGYRAGAAAVETLVRDLGGGATPGGVRQAVADALGDPTVELAYWRAGAGDFVTREGHPVDLGELDATREATLVERDGERIGAIVHDAALSEQPGLVRSVAAAAALAVSNEALEAELRARVEELERSRARLLEISLFERRAGSSATCTTEHSSGSWRSRCSCRSRAPASTRIPGAAGELLDQARGELAQGLEELRELARGIHPAILSERGLEPALRALAGRSPGAVELDEVPPERLPMAVEAAVYFVVSEALTNVAKYAHASATHVDVSPRERPRDRRGPRRRRRRRRPAQRHGPGRARRPARGARRQARRHLAGRRGNHDPGGDPMRAVVADDSVLLREGLVRLLEERGIEVVGQAGDAEDLLRKVGAHRPDIAIVDVRMPPIVHRRGPARRRADPRAAPRDAGARALAGRRGGATRPSCSPRTPTASATCSRTASPTSTASSTPCAASARAATRSTRPSSRVCSARRRDGPARRASRRASAR